MARPFAVRLAAGAAAAAVTALGGVAFASGNRAGSAATGSTHRIAWVDVAVATVWIHRSSPRGIDLPALQHPARLTRWLANLDTAQRRRALTPRVATQLRYGEPVVIRKTVDGLWSRVRIPDQTGNAFPDGIVGWVPTRQLSTVPLSATDSVVTVTARRTTVRLRAAGGWRAGPRLSYATALPYLRTTTDGHWVVAAAPGGSRARLRPADVSVHPAAAPAITPTARAAVEQASRFRGLPYLWAGMSAFGFDCSGLTATVYRQLGVTLARDAADQGRQGHAVARRDLRPGDLVFFGTSARWSSIFHVGMYVGHGRMLHAPHSGAHVSVVRLWHFGLTHDYWGARRYLPGG